MPTIRECLNCGKRYLARPSEIDRKFCSAACYRGYEKTHGPLHDLPQPVQFNCKTCGKPFEMLPGALRAYEKKWGKQPQYCSRSCSGKGRMLSDDKWQVFCVQCGKPMPIQRRPGGTINRQKKLCSTECRSKFRQEHAPNHDGRPVAKGRNRRGYITITLPAYLSGSGKRKEMLEHRYVMEQHLGRPLLPNETVHHISGDRTDNRLENLELFSSRHGPGQRVVDKVAFAIAILTDYPEFCSEAGYRLVRIADEHAEVSDFLCLPG